MSVTINHPPSIVCNVYAPDGEIVGVVTSGWQLNDVRLQIQNENVNGYYLIWDGAKFLINRFGMIPDWPRGFFDQEGDQCEALLRNSLERKKTEMRGRAYTL